VCVVPFLRRIECRRYNPASSPPPLLMTAQLTLSQAPKVGTTRRFPSFENKNAITTVPPTPEKLFSSD
jgi:hypothetical protein